MRLLKCLQVFPPVVENPCPRNRISRRAGPRAGTECCRHRGVVERPERAPQKTRSFPGVSGRRRGRRGTRLDTPAFTECTLTHPCPCPRAPTQAHSAGLVLRPRPPVRPVADAAGGPRASVDRVAVAHARARGREGAPPAKMVQQRPRGGRM